MKVLIINTDYLPYIKDTYNKNPDLKNLSFKKQLDFRYRSLFGISNFYSINLNKLGVSAIDLFVNHPYIQVAWARENGIRIPFSNQLSPFPFFEQYFNLFWEKILFSQVVNFRPDVLVNLAMETVTSDFLNKVKKETNIRVVGQHAAVITENMSDLSLYDLILSSIPEHVNHFKKKGVESMYFKLAFEKTILDQIKASKKKFDVVHIGGYGSIHNQRNSYLETLAHEIPVDFWGYGEKNLGKKSPILKNFHGQVWGKDMYKILLESKIGVTKHITKVAGKDINNMSLYETTGMGTMLLTDYGENLHDLFVENKEVVVYRDKEEFVEKVKYYAKNTIKREKIAKAGQRRTLGDHTYEIRMRELLEIFRNKSWIV